MLSTADGEVRVAENLCADIAMEFIRDWLGECEVISTILSLVMDVCYCHFESVRLKSVVFRGRKNYNHYSMDVLYHLDYNQTTVEPL